MKAGDQLGSYTLVRTISEGKASGNNYVVWLGEKRDPVAGTKRFALKIVPATNEEFTDQLKKEVAAWDAASEDNDPNIVRFVETLYYKSANDGVYVIVSEYAPNGSLEDLIKERERENETFSSQEIKQIMRGLLSGLAYLHSKNIVHRDVKPANIVFRNSTPKLIDFGISRILVLEQSAIYRGTPYYNAPEAIYGERPPSVDLWSAAVVFYRLLTGVLPFPKDTQTVTEDSLRKAILREAHRPLSENFPPEYHTFIRKAFEKVSENRYQTATEMQAAIAQLPPLATDTIPSSLKPTETDSVTQPITKSLSWLKYAAYAALAMSVLVIAGLLIWKYIGRQNTDSSGTPKPIASTVAPQSPKVWRLATSWPEDLPLLSDKMKELAKRISDESKGALTIEVLSAGQAKSASGTVIQPRKVFEAVSEGKIEMAHTAAYYHETIPGAVFFSAVPFGMRRTQHENWLKKGGGYELWRDLYAKRGVIPFVCGHTGPQMGGWFKKEDEIKTISDFDGLSMRIPGLGGKVLAKHRVTTSTHEPDEIIAAGKNGSLDAAEWIGPFHDSHLGLFNYWKLYYSPGWQEYDTALELVINKAAYESLSPDLQETIKKVAEEYNRSISLEFDTENANAEQQLKSNGRCEFKEFPKPVLDQLEKTTKIVIQEHIKTDSDAQKIYDSYRNFQEASKSDDEKNP